MSYIIDKFIKKSGQFNYACVVLIINNDIYANPGMILSESLKKIGCLCDLVAMIDDKISKETIKLLKNFFNKIIKINTIKINHISPIQNVILSKINVFNLIEYKYIILTDVDTIFFTNPDILFSKLSDNNKDSKLLYMPDNENYGFILIKPSKHIFNELKSILDKYKNQIEKDKKPFEYILKKIYKNSDIKKLDFKISYDKYSDVDCIQYRKDKPFLMGSNLTIEKRQMLDHFKVWFSYFTNILNKYPEIKEYKYVQETIQVSKYFLSSLSRFIIDFQKSNSIKNNKLSNVSDIYGINDFKNLDYYHLDIFKEYTNRYVKYNKDTYDLKSFLEYLDMELIKNKNSKLFTNFYKYSSTQELIKKLTTDDINLLYIFLNNYIKIVSKVFVTMEIYSLSDVKKQSIPDLKNNLIYTNQYKLKNIQLKNIIFNLYQNFTYNQRIQLITKEITEDEYIVIISVYEMIIPIIEFDKISNLDMFIFFEQGSKIRLSSIFFNPNTINQYNDESNIFNIYIKNTKIINMSFNQIICMVYLQTLKKYIYSIYSGDEINNLALIVNDYNQITIIDNNKHSISKIKVINLNKIFFITIIFSNSSQYKNIINNKKIDTKKIYDINSYWEIEGIKILLSNN